MELFRVYTYGVVRKGTVGRHELADLVKELREAARMSREQLAEVSEVSVGPIKRIESEGHVPKAQTLQQIAAGLATYAPGRRDEQLAADYYQRLMRAAGYLETAPVRDIAPRRPVEDLTDDEVREALTRHSQDPTISAELLSTAEDWSTMEPEAQRFLLNGIEGARAMDRAIKAAKRSDARRTRPRS